MEHRCGERHRTGMTVLVRRRGWAGSIVGEIRDISISGAYLQLEAGTLPLHAQVRLEARLPGPGGARLMYCTAMVVRTERGGVGVVFDQPASGIAAPLHARRAKPRENALPA